MLILYLSFILFYHHSFSSSLIPAVFRRFSLPLFATSLLLFSFLCFLVLFHFTFFLSIFIVSSFSTFFFSYFHSASLFSFPSSLQSFAFFLLSVFQPLTLQSYLFLSFVIIGCPFLLLLYPISSFTSFFRRFVLPSLPSLFRAFLVLFPSFSPLYIFPSSVPFFLFSSVISRRFLGFLLLPLSPALSCLSFSFYLSHLVLPSSRLLSLS